MEEKGTKEKHKKDIGMQSLICLHRYKSHKNKTDIVIHKQSPGKHYYEIKTVWRCHWINLVFCNLLLGMEHTRKSGIYLQWDSVGEQILFL